MPEFSATTQGFAPQSAAVNYMLDAYGTPAQLDANLQAAADRLVRALDFPIIPRPENRARLAAIQNERRQQLANIVDARHALALAEHVDG